MPHKQAGHMKATDQNRPENNALAKGASTYESQNPANGNPPRFNTLEICSNARSPMAPIQTLANFDVATLF
jgi:hypothetical protein